MNLGEAKLLIYKLAHFQLTTLMFGGWGATENAAPGKCRTLKIAGLENARSNHLVSNYIISYHFIREQSHTEQHVLVQKIDKMDAKYLMIILTRERMIVPKCHEPKQLNLTIYSKLSRSVSTRVAKRSGGV